MKKGNSDENRSPERNLAGFVSQLADWRILVIGDLFLDEYIEGSASRLSREAPIPVLEFERRFFRPGGGANPARNIVALDGHATQIGVIGNDDAGWQLLAELKSAGIDTSGVIVDAGRPTTTKTRIISRGGLRFPQQLARVDRVDRRPVEGKVLQTLESHLRSLASKADAILISDYRTSVMTDSLIAAALDVARASGQPIVVDSQGTLERYQGFNLVKCNQREAAATLSRPLVSDEDVERACEDLLDSLAAESIVITRGPQGIAGASRQEGFVSVPAVNQMEVYDVVGAGDTVSAVLAMALAARLPFEASLQLANYAAGLVVRKLGNATTSQEELRWAIDRW